jgi:hypothetical protein
VRAAWDKSDAARKLDGFGALSVAGAFVDAGMAAGKANHLPKSFVKLGVGMDRTAAKKWQDTAEMFEPNPIIDIDLGKGTVKLGAPYFGRKKWGGTDDATTSSQTSTTDSGNASSGGTPAVNSSQSSNASSTSSGAGNSAQSSATPTSQSPTPTTAKAAPKPLPKRPTPPTNNGIQPKPPGSGQ